MYILPQTCVCQDRSATVQSASAPRPPRSSRARTGSNSGPRSSPPAQPGSAVHGQGLPPGLISHNGRWRRAPVGAGPMPSRTSEIDDADACCWNCAAPPGASGAGVMSAVPADVNSYCSHARLGCVRRSVLRLAWAAREDVRSLVPFQRAALPPPEVATSVRHPAALATAAEAVHP
jgi:hypothetical protein